MGLPAILASIRDENQLWTPYGLRSISKNSTFYKRENAPGDAPYWRGALWINVQYLALYGLHHYAHTDGPSRAQALRIYTELRQNVIRNLHGEWLRTNYLWEQYSD